MNQILHRLAMTMPLWIASQSFAAAPLSISVENIAENKAIPPHYALCKSTPDGKSTAGDNIRPEISWSGAPAETKSFAIIMHDPDVPKDFSSAGKDGTVIKADAPRQDFYHWGVVDIPASQTHIAGGSTAVGTGISVKNDLGAYMPDPKNYGGPCPPWNDARLHHYHFTIYALNVASLKLGKDVSAKQVAAMLKKNAHVVARGASVGTYTLNAALQPK
jgi:Raf kinase inhibitor-like YbhB/YbcL family protein